MKRSIIKNIGGALSFAALCCSASISLAASDKDTYQALIQESMQAQKKASRVGSEWRDIGKIIAAAEKAAAANNYEKAVKLAKKATAQGEQGYKQYHKQKNAGPLF